MDFFILFLALSHRFPPTPDWRLVGILERMLFEERFSKACYAWSVASHSRERFEVIPSFQAVVGKRTINDRGNALVSLADSHFFHLSCYM